MIVDASAIVTILLREPGFERFALVLSGREQLRMSAVSWFEAAMVIESRGGPTTSARFDEMITVEKIEIVGFTPRQARLARDAWQRYGKGRHKAALNFGDCMTYALARELREPLLFKGDDFPHTDITPALSD